MELDSVNLAACLSVERAQSMLNCLESFQRKRAVPLKHFQRLLGHMASTAAVTLLGLLHMRPLQHWLHDRVPRWAWRRGTYRVSVTPSCRQTFFSPWSDLAFLQTGALTSARPSGRMATPPRGSPADLETLRDAPVDLFASPDTSHCQLFLLPVRGDPRHGRAGTQLASGPTQICVSPPVSLLAQTLCKVREEEEQVLLVVPYWPNRTWFPETDAPRDSPSLANSSEEGSPFSERGHPLAPASRLVESPRMVPERAQEVSSWATSSGSKHHHFS